MGGGWVSEGVVGCGGCGLSGNETDTQHSATIVLSVPGPFRNLKMTEFWVH